METFDWDALETEELSQATRAAVSPVASVEATARSRSPSTGSGAAGAEELSFNAGDFPEEDVREWYVSYERVAVRASPQLEGEVLGVLARGRVLRGILYHWETIPWLKVKLEDVNGGPLAAQEWRVELPGAVLRRLHGTGTVEVKELPVGSLLYGRPCEDSETAQLKTRQGRVNRYEGGKEVLKRLPDRFAWILVEADHLGLGALLQPLVDHCDGSDGNHVAEPSENLKETRAVQLRRVRDRGLGLFAMQKFEQGDCVLGDRPFFRRPSFAQLRQQKLFTKSFREKFEQIKVPFTRGDEVQSHIYASASMLRSAVSFCGASLMAQQMILELHHPPLSSEHPLVRVCGAVAKLCRAQLPACRDMQEELLQRAILSIEMNMFVGECCFLMLSRMNHSCFPNVVYMSDKKQFRALRPIQRGEELLHSYLGRELLLPTELRRRLLWRSKCFECQCERCVAQEDPMRTVACSCCAEMKEKYQVVFDPGIWLRADPSLQGKQLSFLTVGTGLQGKGVMKNNWLQVEAKVGCGWVLLDGRSLVPPLRHMLCVRVDANGQPCCDSFDGSPLPTWPGRRLWHAAASQLLPPDDVQTPVADDETEEEAFARDVLNDLRLEHMLPCAAFEEGSARCSFDVGTGTWQCGSCGQQAEASLLATERLLGRLAERTFFSPKMTPALGNVSGAAMNMGANLKMVKRLFVRQAFELSGACAGVLGHRHWSVQWARLFLVDLVISRLSYGTGKGRDLGLLMCQALQELWSWLKTLHLSHDPSCFLLTRTLEAQRLLGSDPDPDVREQLQRLQALSSSCTKQVDILPLRPLIIDGSISFQ
ncbi:unnamed protein product [Cladocopium goreaui]|uniref:SET domain-containing protein L678 n=1 Tax=Cladocopium goreaui TaxID=2562237 RepID=A0A9P1GN56_9DINO|nr:unnamed protein product [Cladocopium goreaui]